MQVGSSSGPSGTSVSEAHAVFYFWVVTRAIAIVHSVLRVSLTILTNNSKERFSDLMLGLLLDGFGSLREHCQPR